MSKDLVGSNGNIVGSEGYFERLNREHFIGNLMQNPNGAEYYDCLRDTASQIRDAVQEIYEDLKKHIGIIRYIPREDRENLIKVLLGLYDICKITSASSGRHSDCVSILSLSDSDTRPKSRADDREIEEAASMVRNSSMLSRSDRMDVIREAMNWGERAVSGNLEKVLFLRAVGRGKDREFFGDVWLKLMYADDPRQFTGRCGRVICTQEYIDHIEQHIFGRDIPNYYGGRNGDRAYGRLITSSLESIVKEIERDLEQGIRDNDYMQDENADRLKEALKDLERCGVQCYSLERKVDALAWFVGGDPEKIRQLQQKLNELGIGERLKEDGVFGVKTLTELNLLHVNLERGLFPILVKVDPLQSNITGIKSIPINGGVSSLQDFSKRSTNREIVVFRADTPHPKQGIGHHINTVEGKSLKKGKYLPSDIQRANINKWNHTEIPKPVYDVLKDFDGYAKKIRMKSGKVFAVMGPLLDALELGQAIAIDKTDADRKLGKTTVSAVTSIGGSWALGSIGAKGGAALGATIGTAIFPGPGTAIGGVVGGTVFGIAGSYGGSALGRYVVDVTVVE